MTVSVQYISFANKYRPKNFAELRMQHTLSEILSNSITIGRIAQSYLLTGIRGVGKTSSARIIAKTVNCNQRVLQGKHLVPCNECANCLALNNFTHPDILEIDAASKTGVDDIRELLKSSEYKPLLGTYKVFIIDEIHMLSKSAFNALLKILEEPPSHVIFIFATTEVQRIPATILSRCQRYDLHRFSFAEILSLITHIAHCENISFSDNALRIIAFKSEGSARDAITILEQVSNICSVHQIIDEAVVSKVLGLLEVNEIKNIIKAILNANLEESLAIFNKCYDNNIALESVVEDICHLLSYCCKRKLLPAYSLPLYINIQEEIDNLIQNVEIVILSILWQIFDQLLQNIKVTHNPYIAIEMSIIKAIYAKQLPKISDITSDRAVLPRQ